MQGRFKMEYRLFTIVRYNYRDYNNSVLLASRVELEKNDWLIFFWRKGILLNSVVCTTGLQTTDYSYHVQCENVQVQDKCIWTDKQISDLWFRNVTNRMSFASVLVEWIEWSERQQVKDKCLLKGRNSLSFLSPQETYLIPSFSLALVDSGNIC